MPQLLLAFYTSGAINQVYGILAIGFLTYVIWQLICRRNLYFTFMSSVSFQILCLFGIFYAIIGYANTRGIAYYFACPIMAFVTGWTIIEVNKFSANKTIKCVLYFMLVGYAVHAFLNWKVNTGNVRWLLVDFFTGEFRAATGSGCINTLIFSIFAYLLVLEKNIGLKAFGILAFFISMRYAFLLGSRTQFIIFLLVSVVFLFLYLYERYGKTTVLRFALILCILSGLGFAIYHFNILNLHTYIDDSNLMARYSNVYGLEDSDDYRFNSIWNGISSLFTHPFGGLEDTGYYHNFWLDIGRIAGILPFGFMLLYSFIINWHMFLIIRNKKVEGWLRYLLFCVYFGVQLNFATEPVLEGLFDSFLCFTVINGMVECYYYKTYLPIYTQKKDIMI